MKIGVIGLGYDLVAIVTAHPQGDYEQVVAEAQLVVDFRGVTRGIAAHQPGPALGGALRCRP